MEELLVPIIIGILGLIVGVIIKSLTKYIRIPYTVALFAFGIAMGVIHRFSLFGYTLYITDGIKQVANLDPNFVLYVFLPILVFDAAYEMNLHVFKKTLLNASILAGPGLVICMLLTAALVMSFNLFLPDPSYNWTWTFALMFGALISATDPVAVVALLQELKTSKRFSTLVDGESLLNDGTGIVCFMLFYGAFAGQATSMDPVTYFLYVCLGSVMIGYVIARITLWFVTRLTSEEVIQNCAMIIAAYLTFIIAQYFFDISGVIALVAYGHIFSQKGRPLFKPEVNQFMSKFWGLLAHISNTLIFIIVGIIIANRVNVTWEHIVQLLILYVGLNVIRYVMIMMLYPLLKRCGYGITKSESVILTWGGLRGALGMSLALMVSNTESIPSEVRENILFFTAGIVTLTMCINATTAKWMVKKLNLIKLTSGVKGRIDARIQNDIRTEDLKSIDRIKKEPTMAEADWSAVESCIPEQAEMPDSKDSGSDLITEMRVMLLENERKFVNSMYENGVISKASYSQLLDSIEDMFDYEGAQVMDSRKGILSERMIYFLLAMENLEKSIGIRHPYLHRSVEKLYDQARGFLLSQQSDKMLLGKMRDSDLFDRENKEASIKTLEGEIDRNIASAEKYILRLKEKFEESYGEAVTARAKRILFASERNHIDVLMRDGMITGEEAINLLKQTDSRQERNLR